MAIGLVWSKIVALSTLFVVSMGFGTIVNLVVRYFKRKGKTTTNLDESLVVRLLNCFAGGLFLGTFLLGLLPEVRELFEDILPRYGVHTHFPLTEATAGAGFFCIMFLEHLIEMCQHGNKSRSHGHNHGQSHGHSHSHFHDSDFHSDGHKESGGTKPPTFYYGNGRFTSRGFDGNAEDNSNNSNPTNNGPPSTVERTSRVLMDDLNFRLGERNVAFDQLPDNDTQDSTPKSDSEIKLAVDEEDILKRQDQKTDNVILGSNLTNSPTQLSGESVVDTQSKKSALRTFVLVLALSLHTLFEGLAFGLLDQEVTIWALLIAVSIHKAVIVMALSIELSKNDNNSLKRIYLILFVFSIVTPIGVGVGTAITETGSPNDLATDTAAAILQGIATGTFLYVTFFEVLNRELETGYDLRKVLAIMIGFSGIIGVKFLHDD